MKNLPNLSFEKRLWEKGYWVIGVDEVGRGSLAGPLYVGAVCFKAPNGGREKTLLLQAGINDSKKLRPLQRRKLAKFIQENSFFSVVSSSPVTFINKYGITKATQRAMRQAIREIQKKLNGHKIFVLADAFYVRHLRGVGLKNQQAIIKGDGKSISIAAASIVAKVARDKLMRSLAKKHPNYKWGRNKGYATRIHIEAIKTHGKTRLHRDLYLRKILIQQSQ